MRAGLEDFLLPPIIYIRRNTASHSDRECRIEQCCVYNAVCILMLCAAIERVFLGIICKQDLCPDNITTRVSGSVHESQETKKTCLTSGVEETVTCLVAAREQ